MKNLMVQVESYPDLKANSQFSNLQFSWNEAEEQIAAGRRFVAASITDYNDTISTFPGNIIASMTGSEKYEWQRATSEQIQNINADKLFN
jgi:LemA protein